MIYAFLIHFFCWKVNIFLVSWWHFPTLSWYIFEKLMPYSRSKTSKNKKLSSQKKITLIGNWSEMHCSNTKLWAWKVFFQLWKVSNETISLKIQLEYKNYQKQVIHWIHMSNCSDASTHSMSIKWASASTWTLLTTITTPQLDGLGSTLAQTTRRRSNVWVQSDLFVYKCIIIFDVKSPNYLPIFKNNSCASIKNLNKCSNIVKLYSLLLPKFF